MSTPRRVRFMFLVPLILGVTGCAVHRFNDEGLPKAAFDLQCDKEKIQVTRLGDRSVGVQGCGKQARYEFAEGVGWVRNSSE